MPAELQPAHCRVGDLVCLQDYLHCFTCDSLSSYDQDFSRYVSELKAKHRYDIGWDVRNYKRHLILLLPSGVATRPVCNMYDSDTLPAPDGVRSYRRSS